PAPFPVPSPGSGRDRPRPPRRPAPPVLLPLGDARGCRRLPRWCALPPGRPVRSLPVRRRGQSRCPPVTLPRVPVRSPFSSTDGVTPPSRAACAFPRATAHQPAVAPGGGSPGGGDEDAHREDRHHGPAEHPGAHVSRPHSG